MTEPPPQISGVEYLRLVGLGALIGIPAALVAALFLAVVHELEDWLWTDLPDASGIVAAVVPRDRPARRRRGDRARGAALAPRRRRPPAARGDRRRRRRRSRHAPGIALAAIGTLAFGAVLGPEAPLIALGSVVGVAVRRPRRRGRRETRVLAMRRLVLGHLGAVRRADRRRPADDRERRSGWARRCSRRCCPGFVAAAVGYVIFIGLGDWGGLERRRPRRAGPAGLQRHARARPAASRVAVGVVTVAR